MSSFLILLIISTVNGQTKRQFTKVQKSVSEQKLYELVIEKLNTKKDNGCLTYKRNDNTAVKYCDNKSEENYVEFDELGKIKNTEIIVVNKFTYNEELTLRKKTIQYSGFNICNVNNFCSVKLHLCYSSWF